MRFLGSLGRSDFRKGDWVAEEEGMNFVRRRLALLWWSASWASEIWVRSEEEVREAICLLVVWGTFLEEIVCLDITGEGGRTLDAV